MFRGFDLCFKKFTRSSFVLPESIEVLDERYTIPSGLLEGGGGDGQLGMH